MCFYYFIKGSNLCGIEVSKITGDTQMGVNLRYQIQNIIQIISMNIFSVRHSKASEKSTLTYRTKKEPKRESSDSSPTFRNKDK